MAHRSQYLPHPNKYQGFLGGNNNQNNNNNNNSQDGIGHKMTETERIIAQAGGTVHGSPTIKSWTAGLRNSGTSGFGNASTNIPDNIPFEETGAPSEEIFDNNKKKPSQLREELDNSRNNSSNNRYYQRSDSSFIPPRSSRTQSSGSMVPNSRVKKRKVKGSTRANNMQRRGQQTKLDVRRKSDREHKKRQKRNSEEKFRNNSNRHKFDQNGPLSQSMTGNYDGNSQRSSNSRKRRAENNNSSPTWHLRNNNNRNNNYRRQNPQRQARKKQKKNRTPDVVDLLSDDDDDDVDNGQSGSNSSSNVNEKKDLSPLKISRLGADGKLQWFEYVLFGEYVFASNDIELRFAPEGLFIAIKSRALNQHSDFSFTIGVDDINAWTYGDEKAPRIGGLSRIIQITLNENQQAWNKLQNLDTIFKGKFPRSNGINNSIFIIVENEHFRQFEHQIESYKIHGSELSQMIETNAYWKNVEIIEEDTVNCLGSGINKYVQVANNRPTNTKRNITSMMDGERRRSPRINVDGGSSGSRSNNNNNNNNSSSSNSNSSSIASRTRRNRHRRTSGPAKPLFTYPFHPEKPRVTITDHDRNRCEDDFLNDNLIDFSLMRLSKEKYLIGEKDLYIFSSFFYKRYIQGKSNYRSNKHYDNTIKSREDLAYSYVEKWTKNIDIFQCKYLLIPVNKDIHWSLLIVCNPDKINVPKGTAEDDDDYFCIYHLDSLGCHNTKALTMNIYTYLKKAWKVMKKKKDADKKKEGDTNNNDEKKEGFARLKVDKVKGIPKQANSTDCGVFVTLYAEHFLKYLLASGKNIGTVTRRMFIEKQYDKIFGMKFRERGNNFYPWFNSSRSTKERFALKRLIDDKEELYNNIGKLERDKVKYKALKKKDKESNDTSSSSGINEKANDVDNGGSNKHIGNDGAMSSTTTAPTTTTRASTTTTTTTTTETSMNERKLWMHE